MRRFVEPRPDEPAPCPDQRLPCRDLILAKITGEDAERASSEPANRIGSPGSFPARS